MLCRLFGHRLRFSAEGRMMRWRCARDCGIEGEKLYSSAAAASRYAAAFDREDREAVGRRPLLSLLPLRLGRSARGKP